MADNHGLSGRVKGGSGQMGSESDLSLEIRSGCAKVNKMDVVYRLSSHLALFKEEDLPKKTIDTAKRFLLDVLGAAMAGTTAAGCQSVKGKIVYWGGRKESTIFVFGGKVPSYHAALINGMFCHARELDDGHEEGGVHTYASILPAALAVGEERGSVSGKEFLTALVLGIDLVSRIALSIRYLRGWHLSGISGGFGAAAAAGRILRFDPERMRHALGIAYAQTAGVGIGSAEAVMTKRMTPGFASRSGVMAAYLAQGGVTGPQGTFESKDGFFKMFDGDHHNEQELRFKLDGSLYSRESLTKDLGKEFEGDHLYMKAFPSCRFTQAPIQATLKIVQKVMIEPEGISKIRVYVCKRAMKFGKPFQLGEFPEISAQFSIPYVVASCVLRKEFFLENVTEKAVCDPRVLKLAEKVEVIHDPVIKLKVPVTVEIETDKGDRYRERVDQIKGNPSDPLTDEEVNKKFYQCAEYSARSFSRDALEELIETVENLERLPDIRLLTQKLVGRRKPR